MDWLLTYPQMHSTFSSLGAMQDDNFLVSPNAVAILDGISCNLSREDPIHRTVRRAIGFGQHIKLDLIPLLINAKNPDILDATIKILVNLTVPVECLFQVDDVCRTPLGNCTIFELNKLLITSKEAFTDAKSTKAILDYMKLILENDTKLSADQCDSVNNCLLLLRNILHVPEQNASILVQGHHNGNSCTSMQNIILWNLFIQSIDKLLIYLLSCPQKSQWGVTIVQLIALMYKDQHVSTLQKLLNTWFESSLSESSEDNESNTSPPKQASGDSSPMLTSDPTSDSSDNGGSGKQINAEDWRQKVKSKETESTLQEVSRKGHEYQNAILRIPVKQQVLSHQSHQCLSPNHQGTIQPKYPIHANLSQKDIRMKELPQCDSIQRSASSPKRGEQPKSPHSVKGQRSSGKSCAQKRECPSSLSENSDCGYGTQVENQESISTSSNEDDIPQQKPKPPCNQKQRYNSGNKQRSVTPQDKKEWRRKKLVKRSKSNQINMKGLVQHVPTDEDISNILKEFTVDFLLKGYGYLVQVLHTQLLSDLRSQIDTSHFFWLVTYFLKFAAQLELDLEHISPVLSFEIISYLTFEGATLCEQLEINAREQGNTLKPYLRRIHLVVTAIREILQALEMYSKITHLSQEDRHHLRHLQIQICSTEDLRCLFILLLRRYNPILYGKQYLQDLIVTNHILLLLLDGVSKATKFNIKMMEHIEQFATVEIMYHYGLLLEDFRENGEFVNDCIFTMMHHIGGDLGQVGILFQPNILKIYSNIWETEYDLCDDWSDLIEYVIHKFMNTQQKTPLAVPLYNQPLPSPSLTELTKEHNMEHSVCTWTQEERDSLQWYFAQSKKAKDIIGKIRKFFNDSGNIKKTRLSIIHQLLEQDMITLVQYDDLMQFEDSSFKTTDVKASTSSTTTGESGIEIKDPETSDDIQLLKDRLQKENKGKLLLWLQKVLMECCYVKLRVSEEKAGRKDQADYDIVQIMEAIPYHFISRNKSVPLILWNSEQEAIMLHQPFLSLLHKLGFHLPQDVRMVFARIPSFWTAEILYQTAQKLGPIDKCELAIIKFDLNLLSCAHDIKLDSFKSSEEFSNETFAIPTVKHSKTVIRFTPDPASTPSVPNWLQLVMRSKCTASDRTEKESITAKSASLITHTTCNQPSTSKMQHNFTDGDSIMRSIGDTLDDEFNLEKRINPNSDSIALMTNSYDEILNGETDSVASDLTRMYVSDEDEKN